MKILIFALVFGMLPVFAPAADIHLIMVNGVAERSIEPNMLVLRVESWAKAPNAKKAQELQASQYSKLKNSLEKFKIKKEDVQTDSYNVYPEYFYDQKNQTNRIVGYRVSHTFSVIYRNVGTAGDFLDQIVKSAGDISGVNINGVAWDSDQKAEAELALLKEAVKAAKDRANELAKAAGVTIKATHKIQNNAVIVQGPQPFMEKAATMMMSDRTAPTELSGGQIKVRAEVQMEFEI